MIGLWLGRLGIQCIHIVCFLLTHVHSYIAALTYSYVPILISFSKWLIFQKFVTIFVMWLTIDFTSFIIIQLISLQEYTNIILLFLYKIVGIPTCYPFIHEVLHLKMHLFLKQSTKWPLHSIWWPFINITVVPRFSISNFLNFITLLYSYLRRQALCFYLSLY